MGELVDAASKFRRPKPASDQLEECVSSLNAEWSFAAAKNRLNEFVRANLGERASEHANYLGDLNALSSMERHVGLEAQVTAPGFGGHEQLGWLSQFRHGSLLISTPPMPFEAYARAFAVLLFLKVRRDLVTST